MKFTVIISTLFLTSSAFAIHATYDTVYDNPDGSMETVACSGGVDGLADKYPTFGDLPSFPCIGGSSAISGYNSPSCGSSCWKLSYQNNSIVMLAIDHADEGFNLSEEGMNVLTDGQAVELGAIEVDFEPVANSQCGI